MSTMDLGTIVETLSAATVAMKAVPELEARIVSLMAELDFQKELTKEAEDRLFKANETIVELRNTLHETNLALSEARSATIKVETDLGIVRGVLEAAEISISRDSAKIAELNTTIGLRDEAIRQLQFDLHESRGLTERLNETLNAIKSNLATVFAAPAVATGPFPVSDSDGVSRSAGMESNSAEHVQVADEVKPAPISTSDAAPTNPAPANGQWF